MSVRTDLIIKALPIELSACRLIGNSSVIGYHTNIKSMGLGLARRVPCGLVESKHGAFLAAHNLGCFAEGNCVYIRGQLGQLLPEGD
jgi:hypothetical protein